MSDIDEAHKAFSEMVGRANADFCLKEFEKKLGQKSNKAIQDANFYKIFKKVFLEDAKKNFAYTIKKGSFLFRARVLDSSAMQMCEETSEHYSNGVRVDLSGVLYGYDAPNSREPLLGTASPGRGNYAGASYMYAARDEITACCEIKPIPSQLLSLAKFRVKKNLLVFNTQKAIGNKKNKRYKKIIAETVGDKPFDLAAFFESVSHLFTDPVENDDEYYVPQVLSDEIRKTGIDGIVYKSFYTGGSNVLLFNCSEKNIEFLDSRIVEFAIPDYTVLDFNEGKLLQNFQAHEGLLESHGRGLRRYLQWQGRAYDDDFDGTARPNF